MASLAVAADVAYRMALMINDFAQSVTSVSLSGLDRYLKIDRNPGLVPLHKVTHVQPPSTVENTPNHHPRVCPIGGLAHGNPVIIHCQARSCLNFQHES
jgi:hypothetical protein